MHFPLLASLALLPGCPVFTEFLPDPYSVPDALGEYAEVAWSPTQAAWDTLWMQFEESAPFSWSRNNDSIQRLLVHRNAPESCPAWSALACIPLRTPALPNSRTTRWTLRAGHCRDTADIPPARTGTAWQRSGPSATDWQESSMNALPEKKGSPGLPDPLYESITNDCVTQVAAASWKNRTWHVRLRARQCNGKTVLITAQSLFDATTQSFQAHVQDSLFTLPPISGQGSLWLHFAHPPDDFPPNDKLDTLLIAEGASPLRITEVSPCPEEPVPEWLEITNHGRMVFPLQGLSDCQGIDLTDSSFLVPEASVLLTRDSTALRQWLGFSDLRIVQYPLKAMRNSADTLRLCRNQRLLDSVIWGGPTHRFTCPHTFTPQQTLLPPSPGYQMRIPAQEIPFRMKVHNRFLSLAQNRETLRVNIQTSVPAILKLVDRHGTLRMKRHIQPAAREHWTEVPEWRKCPPGPCFLQIQTQEGHHESIVAVIVRP